MVLNKLPRIIFFTILLINVSFTVYAQEGEEIVPGYFLDYEGPQVRIFQRLVWDIIDEYALNYEIVIQVYNNGYRDYYTETTTGFHINISLPPGFYRYSVTPYDYLGRRGEESDWEEFVVLAAHRPRIERFAPYAFFLDQDFPRVLNIAGFNFLTESEIYLRGANNNLIPIEVTIVNRRRAQLIFDDKTLIDGLYDIYIKNPGNLESHLGGFLVSYRKPLDLFIKAAYTPVVPVYGDLKELFGTKLFLTGAAIGFEAVSSRRNTFNGGMEIAASAYFISPAGAFRIGLNNIAEGFMEANEGAAFADLDINMAFQKRFNRNKNTITARFGCGPTFFTSYGSYDYDDAISFHLNFGISSYFLIHEILYLDAGVDFSHYFIRNSFGLIKPRIGLVWKF